MSSLLPLFTESPRRGLPGNSASASRKFRGTEGMEEGRGYKPRPSHFWHETDAEHRMGTSVLPANRYKIRVAGPGLEPGTP
jgi:hypothetical protein